MRKIFYLLIFILFFAGKDYGQVHVNKLPEKDSLDILNDLMSLLDSSDSRVSYALVNMSIGNKLFSLNNYALNAKQSNTSVIIYSPSVGYFHKSGFGLTAGANLLKDVDGFGANQYSVSPSYDLTGNKDINFGISYTHYFVKNKFSAFSSPVQNDFFTSFIYKKTWLRPGIGLGYATGEYKEAKYKDSVINNIQRHFHDSVTYKLKAFSIMATASHQFLWYGVLNNSDGVALTTTVTANAGSAKIAISHKTNALLLFNILNKRGRIPKFQNNKFEMQSVGINLDLIYSIGDLSFEPQLYTDYYLPATESNSKRITAVFAINIGYAF
ncbi:MAG: hypothetical protein ABIQ31_19790 [Ferruginibacter sp.]